MINPHKGRKGVARLIAATNASLSGLQMAITGEAAFRQEMLLAVLMFPLAFWLGADLFERAMLIGSLLFVLVVELLNSAVEAAVDRVGLEIHDLSKRAKDIASAAVFLSLAGCLALWGAALCKRLLA